MRNALHSTMSTGPIDSKRRSTGGWIAVVLVVASAFATAAQAQFRLASSARPLDVAALDPFNHPGQLGLRIELPLYQSWGLVGQYGRHNDLSFNASTDRHDAQAQPSVLAIARDSRSIGLAKSQTWVAGDRLSLTVSQPGSLAGASMPLGFYAPLDGRDFGLTGLRSSARELVTELQYFAPLTPATGLGFSLINRTRPNNNERVADERIMMMRFTTRF